MKLISWNIRGLNGLRKGRILKNMLKQEKPSILFLQETKCNSTILERIATKAWPGGLVTAVDSQGASRGLAILWDAHIIQLNNIQDNKNFIQATFHLSSTNAHGLLTNVYFPQDTVQKSQLLNTLSELNSDRPFPLWISGGDYNMITSKEEKKGSRSNTNNEDSLLKDFINSNWLMDIPTSNGIFTWTNKRAGVQQIASRLDRFLISDNATHIGGEFTASILPFSGSDHWPIELQWNRPGNNLRCPFCFEEFWLSHPKFDKLVKSSWTNFNPSEGSKMARFQQKLKFLKRAIKQWNHKGEKIETHEGIEKEFINYFKKAHQEPDFNRLPAINQITQNIPKVITEEHNSLLIKPINLQEVQEAVQHMKEGKVPGPDGFTANFFHRFWDLIKNEVWQVGEESRELRWMYPGLNATFVALVPKGEDANTPNKYRPIALCNMIYKIV
eukprot:PITA_10679